MPTHEFISVVVDGRDSPASPITETTTKPKPTTNAKESSTMKISDTLTLEKSKLAVLFDLPSWVDEATIKAAMACAPGPDVIRAAAASRRPPAVAAAAERLTARPLLTAAARVQAAADVEHDQFMAARFPTDRRRLQGDVTVHHTHGG